MRLGDLRTPFHQSEKFFIKPAFKALTPPKSKKRPDMRSSLITGAPLTVRYEPEMLSIGVADTPLFVYDHRVAYSSTLQEHMNTWEKEVWLCAAIYRTSYYGLPVLSATRDAEHTIEFWRDTLGQFKKTRFAPERFTYQDNETKMYGGYHFHSDLPHQSAARCFVTHEGTALASGVIPMLRIEPRWDGSLIAEIMNQGSLALSYSQAATRFGAADWPFRVVTTVEKIKNLSPDSVVPLCEQ